VSGAQLRIERAPALCNALAPTRAAALAAPTGRIELVVDGRWGALVNAAFDPALAAYSDAYENSLHVSPTFDAWARGLARTLAERWRDNLRCVVDVGCGGGEFLQLLREAGAGRCVGFEPGRSARLAREASQKTGVEVRSAPFPDGAGDLRPTFVTCRHVLEHIAEPLSFLRAIRSALAPGAGLYLEVPSAAHLLEASAVWDVLYEHCWHFTERALRRLCSEAGFRVLRSGGGFGGQYLQIEAVADEAQPAPAPEAQERAALEAQLDALAQAHGALVRRWRSDLAQLAAKRARICVWGAGTKGVMFLCAMAEEPEAAKAIDCAVDLNPKKQGRFVPRAGVEVVAPEALAQREVGLAVVMNPLYVQEVRRRAAALGLALEVVGAAEGLEEGSDGAG